jgi:EAL domain-containing protein (putative c-di-GMP-specific phosphodiesterase class I)
VEPDAVVLEITESVLMQQTGQVLARLRELKGLGVQLAIDDFGTGYSSLGYLQRFPIDMIKIARPFVEDVGAGVDKSALARAIIGLGETLNLKTVAEGVESVEQCEALIELGCEMGQGYFFAPESTGCSPSRRRGFPVLNAGTPLQKRPASRADNRVDFVPQRPFRQGSGRRLAALSGHRYPSCPLF